MAIRERHHFIENFGEEAVLLAIFRDEAPFIGKILEDVEGWLEFHFTVHALPGGLVI